MQLVNSKVTFIFNKPPFEPPLVLSVYTYFNALYPAVLSPNKNLQSWKKIIKFWGNGKKYFNNQKLLDLYILGKGPD